MTVQASYVVWTIVLTQVAKSLWVSTRRTCVSIPCFVPVRVVNEITSVSPLITGLLLDVVCTNLIPKNQSLIQFGSQNPTFAYTLWLSVAPLTWDWPIRFLTRARGRKTEDRSASEPRISVSTVESHQNFESETKDALYWPSDGWKVSSKELFNNIALLVRDPLCAHNYAWFNQGWKSLVSTASSPKLSGSGLAGELGSSVSLALDQTWRLIEPCLCLGIALKGPDLSCDKTGDLIESCTQFKRRHGAAWHSNLIG